ncbi:MAG: hypothetical protein ACE5FS_03430 [Paracoccaceae bacterium]
MAIAADALIDFFGTADALGTTTSAVTDGSFSDGTNDLTAWTNDDDAPEAAAILTMQYASGTLDANPYVNLYARLIDIDGTTDAPVPDASYKEKYLGRFKIDTNLAATTDNAHAEDIDLPNTETSQVYHFYIENQTGVTISAGWELTIVPKTVGPHA